MKLIKFSNQLFCIHAGSHRDGFKIPSLTKNVYVQTLRFEQQQKMGQFSPDYCQQLTVCQCLFVILPVFLWFSAHSERYWAVWQTGQQLWTCTKPQKDNKITIACLFARLTPVFFLKKRPSFARLFTKMSLSEPVEPPSTDQFCDYYFWNRPLLVLKLQNINYVDVNCSMIVINSSQCFKWSSIYLFQAFMSQLNMLLPVSIFLNTSPPL